MPDLTRIELFPQRRAIDVARAIIDHLLIGSWPQIIDGLLKRGWQAMRVVRLIGVILLCRIFVSYTLRAQTLHSQIFNLSSEQCLLETYCRNAIIWETLETAPILFFRDYRRGVSCAEVL